jgi:hypothetical protein
LKTRSKTKTGKILSPFSIIYLEENSKFLLLMQDHCFSLSHSNTATSLRYSTFFCFSQRKMKFAPVAALLNLAMASGKLISEQLTAYRKLLGTDTLTADGLLTLLKLHDGDTTCVDSCERYLREFIGSPEGMSWDRLEEVIKTIYGDSISNDPYQPQEIHLALTSSPTEMKVIWATMDPLIDPFVEYTANVNEWSEADTLIGTALSYSYTVPQNW